jgi:hypothetical protein
MARPKGIRIQKICKHCNNEFEVPPYLEKQTFCSNKCAQQYKGVDKEWIMKRENTCLEQYGTKNAFQSQRVQKKYKNNLLEKYGVDNPFLVKEIKDKATQSIEKKYGSKIASKNKEVAGKISKTLKGRIISRENFVDIKWEKLEKYYEVSKMKPLFDKEYLNFNKLNHAFQNKFKFQCEKCDEITEVYLSNGYLPSCKCSEYKGYSLIEDELLVFVSELLGEERIYTNRRDILPNRLELDLYIPFHNLAIEVNGVYWHSESMGKYRDYHLYKTEKCIENGIELIHILDYEWIFKKPIIQSILRNKLSKNIHNIYARKCEVRVIEDTKIIREFLDNNHIQGYSHASINLGLYHNSQLVSLMTFAKNRFKKRANEWEMVRFCNMLNTNIVGGASKLFKYFNQTYNNIDSLPIISFADRRFFNGNLYKKLGFDFEQNTKPSYIYWKDNRVLNRMSCQKHKLNKILKHFDSTKSEYENMKSNGWFRVWDSGNIKWVYKAKKE